MYTNIPFIGYVKCQIGLRNLFLTENDPTLNYFSQLICYPEFSSTTKQFRYQLQYFKEELYPMSLVSYIFMNSLFSKKTCKLYTIDY